MGIVQGFALSLLLFVSKKGRSRLKRILAGLLFVTTLSIVGQYLLQLDWVNHVPYFFLFTTSLPFLFGPLLYAYTLEYLQKRVLDNWVQWLHLIPLLLYDFLLIYLLVGQFNGDIEAFLNISLSDNAPKDSLPIIGIAKSLHLLIYTLLSWRELSKTSEDQDNQWLYYLLIGYIVLQGLSWVALGLSIFIEGFAEITDHMFFLILVMYFYVIGYVGLLKPQTLFHQNPNDDDSDTDKYQHSGLTTEDSLAHYQELLTYMESEKPYLSPTLTLNELADQIGISAQHLSQVINEHYTDNYSNFVNSYRVEEVKKLMASSDKQHLTLVALAYEAGFNNKNSFNKYFKKFTGQTPSSYRKQL